MEIGCVFVFGSFCVLVLVCVGGELYRVLYLCGVHVWCAVVNGKRFICPFVILGVFAYVTILLSFIIFFADDSCIEYADSMQTSAQG